MLLIKVILCFVLSCVIWELLVVYTAAAAAPRLVWQRAVAEASTISVGGSLGRRDLVSLGLSHIKNHAMRGCFVSAVGAETAAHGGQCICLQALCRRSCRR